MANAKAEVKGGSAPTIYDAIIIGGGAAGLSCALYASRYNMKVVVFTDLVGGVVTRSQEVENYPGTIKATGLEMMQQWKEHCERFGANIKSEWIESIENKGGLFLAKTSEDEYLGKTLLIATGAKERKLGVPGEHEFEGRGVSSCATCDGMFFKGKHVAVVGGGDAAFRGVQVLVQYCPKVYLIHRRNEFRAEPMNIDRVKQDPNVEFVLGRTVKSIKGNKTVTGVVLDNDQELTVQGVFVEIGSIPNVDLAQKLGMELEGGLIKVRQDQSTNVPGAFAAGDVTTASNNFRQLVTAASEGAIAAESMFRYNRQREISKTIKKDNKSTKYGEVRI